MRRRAFIAGLGGAVAWPVVARAQNQGKTAARVGVLLFGTPDTDQSFGAFRDAFRDLGYIERRSVIYEHRYAEGKTERLRNLAAQLVAIQPDVILAIGGDVAPFARTATSTIPIVMVVSIDPVESGLVASLAHPGGNVTGVSFASSELAGKRLQSLVAMAPNVRRVAVIWNPDHIDPEYRETQNAAKSLNVQIQSLEVRSVDDFRDAFESAKGAGVQALMPVTSRLMLLNHKQILEFARDNRLLVASGFGPWAKDGALFSYGPDVDVVAARAAPYVDKILRGAKPADLPVELPTKFELVINLKTANALGLNIPASFLARADEVIE
jgi:putative tryptophan/tyrosine transport system substrate-binding protein